MEKLLQIKRFSEELNKLFPTKEIPTKMFDGIMTVNVKSKIPSQFLITFKKDLKAIELHCFNYHLPLNRLLLSRCEKLQEALQIDVVVKHNHICMQRVVKEDAILAKKIVIGKVW